MSSLEVIFYNEMGYVNLHFTYLLTYLLAHRRSVSIFALV